MTVTTFDQEEPEDIIVRLIKQADWIMMNYSVSTDAELMTEAADEIEKLRRVLGMTRN
jgi:hypothetical protein